MCTHAAVIKTLCFRRASPTRNVADTLSKGSVEFGESAVHPAISMGGIQSGVPHAKCESAKGHTSVLTSSGDGEKEDYAGRCSFDMSYGLDEWPHPVAHHVPLII